MDIDFIRKRLTALRLKKDVSEYQMSLDMGHSKNYIQNIVNGRSMPSMGEFLYICEYLEITPQEFFDTEIDDPALMQKIIEGIRTLSDEDKLALLPLIERLKDR